MGDHSPPFFMSYKQKVISALSNPLFHLVLLVGGLLIFIGHTHNEAHKNMELDVNSYVKKFCNKNRSTCESYISDY